MNILNFIKNSPAPAGEEHSPGLYLATAFVAYAAATVSILMSASFAWHMGGDSLAMQLVFIAVFLAFQVVEFSGAFHISRAYNQRKPVLLILCLIALISGVAASYVAGQSNIANRVELLQHDKLIASESYQAGLSAREGAAQLAADTKIERSVYQDALQSKKDAQNALQSVYADSGQYVASWLPCIPATNSRGEPFTSRANAACAKASAYQGRISSADETLAAWDIYQANQKAAVEIASKPLDSVANERLAWVENISQVTGFEYDYVATRFVSTIALLNEFFALLFMYLYGDMRKGWAKGGGIKPAVVRRPGEIPAAVPALNTGGTILADGLAEVHKDEIVLNVSAVQAIESQYPGLLDAANAGQKIAPQNRPASPLERVQITGRERVPDRLSQRQGAGRVGLVDTCIDCTSDFIVRTHNGTRCPECAENAERKHHNKSAAKR